jgi:hypothetical protein
MSKVSVRDLHLKAKTAFIRVKRSATLADHRGSSRLSTDAAIASWARFESEVLGTLQSAVRTVERERSLAELESWMAELGHPIDQGSISCTDRNGARIEFR